MPVGTFADVDAGDTLVLSATGLPGWLAFDAASGTFSGTPANGDVGSVSVTLTATDAAGVAVSQAIAFTVTNVNDAPTVAVELADQVAAEDAAFSFAVPVGTFADVDAGDTLVLSATGLPGWLAFDAVTGTFSGTPANGDVGSVSVTLTATDAAGVAVSQAIAFTVTNVNDAPTVAVLPNAQLLENAAQGTVAASLLISDVDSDVLAASIVLLDDAGGRFALDGTDIVVANPVLLDFEQATSHDVTVQVTDAEGAVTTRTISIGLGDQSPEVVTGGAGNDLILAGSGNDTLDGGAGNDSLIGGTGADMMTGGTGDDTFTVDSYGDAVTELAGEGTDTILTNLSAYSIFGRVNVENLTGTSAAGHTLTGNNGANMLTGAAGHDMLIGGGGDDTLTGNAGNDTLNGGSGADQMDGGAGDDTYIVDSYADGVVEAAGNGTDTIQTSLSAYSIFGRVNVENLISTSGVAQTLTGNSGDNVITGGIGATTVFASNGNDTVFGGAGNDSLDGGQGNDRLDGGTGSDTMIGGLGNDTFVVDSYADVVTEGVGQGTDTIETGLTSFSIFSRATIENLTGTRAGGQTLTGNSGANVLTGAAGSDTLLGGSGADTLIGNAGNDRLDGGADNDMLIGGAGNDTLLGGSGADTFVFNLAVGLGGIDAILDFVDGTDLIGLSSAVFAAPVMDFIVYDAAAGVLSYDADGAAGAGTAVAFAQFAAGRGR